MQKKSWVLIVAILFLSIGTLVMAFREHLRTPAATRLYWLIPDGLRADPETFNLYKWAEAGHLPNIKRMIEEGVSGYSLPDFPSHTPINFASLLTGQHPDVHGIADGPMHMEGGPLARPNVSGFSSASKRAPPIWKLMEQQNKSTVLLSIPGSTPPEIPRTVIRGRWGGWGYDSHNMMFESAGKREARKSLGRAFRLFFLGAPLTQFVEWETMGEGKSAVLSAHGSSIKLWVERSTGQGPYDQVKFQVEDRGVGPFKQGEWTDWLPVKLRLKDFELDSRVKIKLVRIWPDGEFRVRVLYDNLNSMITEPPEVAKELSENVGPMVDHADNWPPQLIFEPEDKTLFLDEMRLSLDWHRKAAAYILDSWKPDVMIQDTYTPNQMLESPWWLKHFDPQHPHYDPSSKESAERDILELYQGIDKILGEAMKRAEDGKTLVVLSSDHGVCPLSRLVKLNNLFAKKGWLKFSIDSKTGEPSIDWENTKVIYLKMYHIYINPKGLAGNWHRASGEDYEKLRAEVITELEKLQDEDGTKPLIRAVKWEDVGAAMALPKDRVGDLVLEAKVNYFWFEEVSEDLSLFTDPLTGGYKQAIDARKNPCIWTPFLMWGPGVPKGKRLDEPIQHVEQLPMILKLLK